MLLCRITTYESTREIKKHLSLIWIHGVAFLRQFSRHFGKVHPDCKFLPLAFMAVAALHPSNSSRVSQRVRIQPSDDNMEGWCSLALKYKQQHKHLFVHTVGVLQSNLISITVSAIRERWQDMFKLCYSGMFDVPDYNSLWCHWVLVFETPQDLSGLGNASKAFLVFGFIVSECWVK